MQLSKQDIASVMAPLAERTLWQARVTRDYNGCWFLDGHGYLKLYRIITVQSISVRAHRAFKIWSTGNNFDFSKIVCHLCTRKDCVSPKHTYLGTRADNIKDKIIDGRDARPQGENNCRAKLTNAEAKDIWLACLDPKQSRADLAKKYKVSETSIYQITARKAWRSVTEKLPPIPKAQPRYNSGDMSHWAKIDEITAYAICKELTKAKTLGAIARQFGLTWHHIYSIKKRASWAHVSKYFEFETTEKQKNATVYKKLSPNMVKDIKRLIHRGVSNKSIADKFKVGPPLISRIKNGKAWADVEP